MLKMVQSNFNLDSFFSLNTKTVRSYYCNLSRWKFLRCVFPKAPKKTWSCVATVFGPFFLSTCAHMLKEKAKFNLRSFFAWTFGSWALFFLTSHSGTNKVQSSIWNQKQARSTLSFKKSFFFKVEVQNIWNQPNYSRLVLSDPHPISSYLFLRGLYSKTRDSEVRWGAGHGAS